MRVKIGLVVVLVMALVSVLLASSVIAIGKTTDDACSGCGQRQCSRGQALPVCCLSGGLPFANCVINPATDAIVLPSGRFTSNPAIGLERPAATNSLANQSGNQSVSPPDLIPLTTIETSTAFHCRNVLSSEDPAAIQ
ncbi:MAG: hypothetical protein PHE50_07610 [Dehalococcoidales bacterium]|nr:hypothetical protein [Dehalococcoidales bacterium]